MNSKHRLILLALAAATSAAAQSTWESVDNLARHRGRDLIADAAGRFVSLAIDDSTDPKSAATTAVNLSTDSGATWDTVGSIAGYALDLTVAPDGALFAAGNRSSTVSGRAFVWQSLDHGVTWTVSDPSTGLASPLIATDVAAGNSGAIYVCGSSGARWMVRKGLRTTNGISWSTIDSTTGTQANSVFVRPATVPGQADDILVCGNAWSVRRSVNGGVTWSTLDNFAGSNQAFALTTAPDGSIYVVGRTTRTVGRTTETGWLVRKSANGGASWTNVDYLVNGWPGYSIAVDAFGRIFVPGTNNNPGTAGSAWIVRGSTDNGATWVTTDTFVPTGTTRTSAYAVAGDSAGNVCVVGDAYTATAVSAPARRLAQP